MQIILSKIYLIFYIVFAVFFSINYFIAYPISGFFIKIYEIFSMILFIFLANLTGKWLIKYSKLNFSSNLEKIFFEFSLGSGSLSLILFFLGITAGFRKIFLFIIIFLILILNINSIKNLQPKKFLHEINSRFTKQYNLSPIEFVLIFISFVCLCLMFLSCFAPPTYYDSLVYHLALPELYITLKKLIYFPRNLYSSFPQNMEMLFTFALLTGDEIVPNLMSFSFVLFTVFGIYSFCNKFFERKISTLAVTLFLSSTSVMLLGPSTYVETGLLFYTFASIYAIVLFLKENSIKYLILSGIFCGFASGVKYTGIIPLLVITAILFYFYIKHKKYTLKEIFIFVGICFLIFSPWAIRNIINTGNPVFPFFTKIFGYGKIPIIEISVKNYFSILEEYSIKNDVLKEFFYSPFNFSKILSKFGSGADVLGTFGWALFFLIFPLVVFIKKLEFPVGLLSSYLILHFSIWFFTAFVLRFLLPIIPIFAIICSYIILTVIRKKFFLVAPFTIFLAVFYTVSNLYIYFYVQSVIQPWEVALGFESKEEYLTRKLKYSPYPVFKFINMNLPDDSKILFIGETRGFYCKRNYIAENVCIPNIITEVLNEAKKPEEVNSYLKNIGFTHILFNKNEAERISSYETFKLNNAGEKIWKEFINNLPLLFSHNNVFLYKLN